MSLLDDLLERMGKKKQPTLRSLLRKQTGISYRNIYVSDKYIDLISDEDMDTFLKLDKSNELPWKPEIFDCDDISRVFLNSAKIWFYKEKNINAAVGWIWTARHAFNFYINQALKIVFIEPSTDQIVQIHSRPKLIIL